MKNTILITGSLGLIGLTTTEFFLSEGYQVIGIDNDFRGLTLKIDTHYKQKLHFLTKKFGKNYEHHHTDISNQTGINSIIKKHAKYIKLIIHTAAQTSHDWAKNDPLLDFTVNATSTLYLLEEYKKYCPDAVFIYTSTNKVYGDRVNAFPLHEYDHRYDLKKTHRYYEGIDEEFSIDHSTHSLFGVSKTSADLLVQEYGRYFGLKTGIFRLGVVTGHWQRGSMYQGFLSYLLEKAIQKKPFTVIGYKGKQVRDIIHAKDVVQAFYSFFKKPKSAAVFNLGGGRKNTVSLLELQYMIEQLFKSKITFQYDTHARSGDHQWWITNTKKFENFYPTWKRTCSVEDILREIYNQLT